MFNHCIPEVRQIWVQISLFTRLLVLIQNLNDVSLGHYPYNLRNNHGFFTGSLKITGMLNLKKQIQVLERSSFLLPSSIYNLLVNSQDWTKSVWLKTHKGKKRELQTRHVIKKAYKHNIMGHQPSSISFLENSILIRT